MNHPSAPTGLKSGTRVLIVEDDPAISRLLELELTHRGAVVHTVADGLLATSAVASFIPQVIVLDVMLPGMWGDEILAAIRR